MLQSALDKERQVSAEALSQVEILNQQLAALRRQLAALNAVLEAAEAKDRESQTQIADLGKRLNSALAQKVQELARFRSEFFGRLRQILSQRSDIRVVGDRFVFQSEVLFPKGSAEINRRRHSGNEEAGDCAARARAGDSRRSGMGAARRRSHRQRSHRHLQLSGRTGSCRPPAPSPWSIFWSRNGVSPQHLVAAGFGEFQPLDSADTEEAKSRNRRIELKLTER